MIKIICDRCGKSNIIPEDSADPGMNRIVLNVKTRAKEEKSKIIYAVCTECEPLALAEIKAVFPHSEVSEE